MSAPDFATIGADAVEVPVAAFRDAIEHLERVVRVDLPACACDREVANWVPIAQRVAVELTNTICKRATLADWQRREAAIDSSASAIIDMSLRAERRGLEAAP